MTITKLMILSSLRVRLLVSAVRLSNLAVVRHGSGYSNSSPSVHVVCTLDCLSFTWRRCRSCVAFALNTHTHTHMPCHCPSGIPPDEVGIATYEDPHDVALGRLEHHRHTIDFGRLRQTDICFSIRNLRRIVHAINCAPATATHEVAKASSCASTANTPIRTIASFCPLMLSQKRG